MRCWLLIIVLMGCQGWRKQDTALELAFAGTTVIDWHQTMDITSDCAESNPMIGHCGDTVPPNLYFPVAIIAHAAIAACLPHAWRTVFQAFSVGVEAGTIYSNERDGYEML
jgi:hypothetical protein